jgi:hypothetical protein
LRNGSEDVDDHTPVLLGFDLMFGPEPVALGFGFWFTTGTSIEGSNLSVGERNIGWEFATPFMLGAAVPVGDTVAVRLGVFGGPEFLFADDDTAQGRDGDAYENLCDDLLSRGQVSECDASSPTRFAWTYGFQAGPVFRTSRYNTVGAELVLQRIDLRLFSVDAEASSWRAKQTYDYGAWRLWIMVTAGVGK